MNINGISLSVPGYQHVRSAADQLFTSMSRLSTGERINRPGDAPADFGISQLLRFQINNLGVSERNVENAINMMNSADAWLQSVHDILGRMSELAIAANDGSKSQADRDNLNQEFLQLRGEVKRISEDARYNGVQIASRDQILTYDVDLETFVFSQLDGTENYTLEDPFISGVNAQNGIDLLFDSANDYTLSHDGKYIYYVDSNEALGRYDINEGTLVRDAIDAEQKSFDIDEEGRLWYARETAPASGVFILRQQNLENWTQDTTIITDADITDLASTEFKVYEDRVFYLNATTDLVSRSLADPTDVRTEISSTDFALSTVAGEHAISQDGKYFADIPAANTLRVINSETGNFSTFSLDPSITPTNMTLNADGDKVMFVDSASNRVYSVDLEKGDAPTLARIDAVLDSSGTSGFAGLSLDGGSHRSRFHLHQGPDKGQSSYIVAGDTRLFTLGLLDVSVEDPAKAQDALARLSAAIDKISLQRATIGGNSSRLSQTYQALIAYEDNISQAESVIRDTKVAEESAKMLDLQVRHQMAVSILAQANTQRGSVVQLLNR